jgi:hypothetical protein
MFMISAWTLRKPVVSNFQAQHERVYVAFAATFMLELRIRNDSRNFASTVFDSSGDRGVICIVTGGHFFEPSVVCAQMNNLNRTIADPSPTRRLATKYF